MKLEKSILKSVLEGVREDSTKSNFYCKCPWCGYSEFGVSIERDNHPFNCFRKNNCGEIGNIFKLLKKVGRLDLLSGFKKIEYTAKLQTSLEEKIEKNLDLTLPTITKPIGFRRIMKDEYLNSRGFDQFDKYEVGETKLDLKYKGYKIFLIKEQEQLKAYVSRSVKTKEEVQELKRQGKFFLRYKNSESDFSKLVFGLEDFTNQTKKIIIVEGIFDKFNVDKLLIRSNIKDTICACTFGSKVSKEQIFKIQILGISHVILMFDGDVIDMTKKYALSLEKEFDKVEVALCSEKDPGDILLEEFQTIISNLYSPIDVNLSKVKILKLK